mgnify:CR=1 FL=1|tara:strand:- start:638 stop:877 length:240 start_codon:yes stop_codon:yes gene_type:complete
MIENKKFELGDSVMILTPYQAAGLLNVSSENLYHLINNNIIPSVKIGSKRSIPLQGIIDFLNGGGYEGKFPRPWSTNND